MLIRILLATVVGVAGFTAISLIGIAAACRWSSVSACDGPAFELVTVSSIAEGGMLVLVVGLGAIFLLRKRSWYRAWQVVPVYLGLATLMPYVRAWHLPLHGPASLFDLVYPIAGLSMGIAIFSIERKRSNNAFKPKPLRGSA